MITTKVSSKYQIVLPSKIRESMKIKVGQQFQLIQYLDRIELIPIKPISEMKGFIKGLNTDFIRDKSDRI
ncbi:MAG: Transcriptional regulator AbrB family [Ignavibacteria bacterium]|nr:Transcriptional regulator AbrB family [Ignavibacteria bacterium]